MTTRRKYFTALAEDWPEVLTDLEETLNVEYIEERAVEDWSHPRYATGRDLPLRKAKGQPFWKRYLIVMSPSKHVDIDRITDTYDGYAKGMRQNLERTGVDDGNRPQLKAGPGTICFDPRGFDEENWPKSRTPEIGQGWMYTQYYEIAESKLIYDSLVRAMRKRFANYKGTLFGPAAYKMAVEDGWLVDAVEQNSDLMAAKKPKLWKP